MARPGPQGARITRPGAGAGAGEVRRPLQMFIDLTGYELAMAAYRTNAQPGTLLWGAGLPERTRPNFLTPGTGRGPQSGALRLEHSQNLFRARRYL